MNQEIANKVTQVEKKIDHQHIRKTYKTQTYYKYVILA